MTRKCEWGDFKKIADRGYDPGKNYFRYDRKRRLIKKLEKLSDGKEASRIACSDNGESLNQNIMAGNG